VKQYHRSVLEREVADFLVRDPGAAYLDATLGGGGHALALLRPSSGAVITLASGAPAEAQAMRIGRGKRTPTRRGRLSHIVTSGRREGC
jgi:16S rRNA (cytosine1402-N4)-methyltransferase